MYYQHRKKSGIYFVVGHEEANGFLISGKIYMESPFNSLGEIILGHSPDPVCSVRIVRSELDDEFDIIDDPALFALKKESDAV